MAVASCDGGDRDNYVDSFLAEGVGGTNGGIMEDIVEQFIISLRTDMS